MPGTTAWLIAPVPSTPKRSLVIALLPSRGARCAPWTVSLGRTDSAVGTRQGHGASASSLALTPLRARPVLRARGLRSHRGALRIRCGCGPAAPACIVRL